MQRDSKNTIIKKLNTDIGLILVTYNRLDKLTKALKSIEQQTKKPSYVIIVDNASNDGTAEYLDKWKNIIEEYSKYVIHNKTNEGGAGGFYVGFQKALELNADWIWVSDDDAYLDKNALLYVYEYLNNHIDSLNDISSISGSVIGINGEYQIDHRRIIKCGLIDVECTPVDSNVYKYDSFEITVSSYVGSVINKKKMEEVGITRKDFFILYDDNEHFYRLAKVGKNICIPKIIVRHDNEKYICKEGVNWKEFYRIRNKYFMYKLHIPKRCFAIEFLVKYLKARINILINRKPIRNRMIIEALRCAKNGKMGLHDIYKPGWSVDKD